MFEEFAMLVHQYFRDIGFAIRYLLYFHSLAKFDHFCQGEWVFFAVELDC